MRGLVLCVPAFLLLAGCADYDGSSDTTQDMELEPVLREPEHYEASFPLIAMDATLQEHNYLASQESDNCVLLDDAALIVAGTATVSWAANPATPAMDLILWASPDDVRYETGRGQVTLDLTDAVVGRDGDTLLTWQVATDQPAGAAIGLEGTLELSFDYLVDKEGGKMNPDEGWTCHATR